MLFDTPKSCSNFARPDFDRFMAYLKPGYEHGILTNDGPCVKELERRLAELHDVKHCVAMCSGFWAIALTLKALAIPGRTEVVMPSLTYRRLADIVAWVGLTPRFCDVDEATLGVTPATVVPCINENTAAFLMPQPIVNILPMRDFHTLGCWNDIPMIFDSVEAAWAAYEGRMIGSYGDAECFSLHASKLINGFEGGYVTTNNPDTADKLRDLRCFGEGGMNAKLNEIHAAMALACLDGLPHQIEENRYRYICYKQDLPRGLRLVEYDDTERRAYKNILVELTDDCPLSRADMLTLLHQQNILARPYYHPPLHTKEVPYKTIRGPLPVTERLAGRYMLLPCGEHVTEKDIKTICLFLESTLFRETIGAQV